MPPRRFTDVAAPRRHRTYKIANCGPRFAALPVDPPVLNVARLSEVKLPLDHPEAALEAAIRSRLDDLGVPSSDLIRYTVFRRAHDARKRSDIKLTYIVDVEVTDEASARKRLDAPPHCGVTPDMAYHFVAKAPEKSNLPRPVVIGMGPCGLFAGLDPRADGFSSDHPRARQSRARADEGHLGPVAQERARSGVERAVRRGRRRHVFRRQAL